jgi:hypothetical protein
VAELSRLLTRARDEREGGYLNRPDLLSAYLRYFLPWNVFRLLKLFEISPLPALSAGDALTDIGSGPLTLPIALWIAFPGFRSLALEFRCIDKSAAALEAGRRLFAALSGGREGGSGPEGSLPVSWKIRTIHGSPGIPIRGKKARLVSAVNLFNEIRAAPEKAVRAAALLDSLGAKDGGILVMEPGNPQGGAFIAALRAALLERGRLPAAPCVHAGSCPMPGIVMPGAARGKPKWCHFTFDTAEVPPALHELSRAAGIPKERAAFSFLLTGPGAGSAERPGNPPRIRVVSGSFPVGRGWGRYGCSERGLVLVTGSKPRLDSAPSGTLLDPGFSGKERKDPKTGAPVIPLPEPEDDPSAAKRRN